MEKRSPVILVIVSVILISSVLCEDGADPKSSLTFTKYQENIKKSSVVDVSFKGITLAKVKDIDKDKQLRCYQRKSRSKDGALITYMAGRYTSKIDPKELTVTMLYHVEVKREGYLWCEYTNTANKTQEEAVQSDVEYFYEKNKQVSVVKLSKITNLESLKKQIGPTQFEMFQLVSGGTIFHFISDNSTTNEETLAEVQKLLRRKSLLFKYVRSTVACPPNSKYKLPSTELPFNPFNTSLATLIEKCCEGDFYSGAYWNETKLKEREDIILHSKNAIQNFSSTLKNLSNLQLTQVTIVAKNFSLLLSAEKDVLKEDKQNTSNSLLAKLESLLGNISLDSGGETVQAEQENFALRVENIKNTGTTGVLVSDIPNIGKINRLQTDSLNKSHGLRDAQNRLTRIGIIFPESLLANSSTPANLAITVFRDTGPLFDTKNDTSSIIGATLGGVHFDNLHEPVVLFFMRNISSYPEHGECVFWDFQADNETGAWSSKGCNYNSSRKLVDDLYLDKCHCYHLSYFGAIFKQGASNLDTQNEQNLELISLVGCSVSLVSLCGVFITAAFSKNWLRGPGQKILLQMAINLAMLLIMYLVAAYANAQGTSCIVVGFFFHYTILSNFFWMAVAGYLQYYRLVKVLSSRTSKLVLKTNIVGWGVPIIPGIVVLSAGKYNSGATLCLPDDGWAFYATILAPICIILVFNVVIFTMIFKNLYMTTRPRQHVDKCISLRRFKQLAFLFTLLGLNWIFGVCDAFFSKSNLLFAYLFNLMVTFQGLTYFIFFVALDKKARNSWKTFTKCCVKMKGDSAIDLTMATTTSTITESQ